MNQFIADSTSFCSRVTRRLGLFLNQPRYHVTFLHSKKLLWFRVAKVCSQTIRRTFKQIPREKVRIYYWYLYDHNRYSEYYKVAFVRNPWDRVISAWNDKVLKNNYFRFESEDYEKYRDLKVFLRHLESSDLMRKDQHLQLQTSLIDMKRIDYLGRFETFNDDFTLFCREFDICYSPTILNQKEHDHYKNYYDGETRRMVFRLYRDDIDQLGYSF